MIRRFGTIALAAVSVLGLAEAAHAQVRLQYGRITNVQATTVTGSTARTVGTIVGGGIGVGLSLGARGMFRTACGARERE